MLYNLGKIPWQQTQLIYHALAYLGREALVLCWPDAPYISLGFHQDYTQELDQDFCRRAGLPLFRREVGGGAVYLDGGQVFWQLILKPDNPLVPVRRDVFYRRFLEPVAAAYRRMGLAAQFRPVNDLAVGDRKVSGTGAGEIGDCVAFVGNVMRDFDTKTMARAIAAPDEEYRELFRQLMERNLSTLTWHLGRRGAAPFGNRDICAILAEEFNRLVGAMQAAEIDDELAAKLAELEPVMLAEDWTRFKRKPRPARQIKVRADLFLYQNTVTLGGGDFTARCLLAAGHITDLRLSLNGRPLSPGLAQALPPLAGKTPKQARELLAAPPSPNLAGLSRLF